MPTYKARGYVPVMEHGFAISQTYNTASPWVHTEARLLFTDCSAYTIGETITETGSATTGVVFWNDGTTLGVIQTSDEFDGAKVITGSVSGATETSLSAENLLQRIADTPVYSPLTQSHSLTSTYYFFHRA